jgi:hypothetical protein
MMKAYVSNWNRQSIPGQNSRVTVEFDPSPEGALRWETREQAENARRGVEEYDPIGIPAAEGRPCKRFVVEERAPKEFVVFCEYPSEQLAPAQLQTRTVR